MKKSTRGLLISFDGANGVGKSSIIEEVYKNLLKNDYNTIKTKEPTDSYLGNFSKSSEEKIFGKAYACIIAADRYYHNENVLIKELENNRIVLSDRYVASSLILQALDGVSMDFIWNINQYIIKPDIFVIIKGEVSIIEERMKNRTVYSRFEKSFKTIEEINSVEKTEIYLKNKKVHVIAAENNNTPIEYTASVIVKQIIKKWNEKNSILNKEYVW